MLLFCRTDLSSDERDAILRAARDAGFLVQALGPGLVGLFGPGDATGLADMTGVERIAKAPSGPVLTREAESTVSVGDLVIGGDHLLVVAGPCAVEERQRLTDLAGAAKDAGADMLRGGAFKPRTSPYSFRGLGREGLELLAEAREATGLPVVTEALDTRDVALVAEFADVVQIGARNMANFALLLEVGAAGKPVLLKRGMSATIRDFLYAAEYVLSQGAPGVILCERGVSGFTDLLRNTLDLSAIPLLRSETPLPVVVDPSHATGFREFVPAMARAAAASGAAGVMVEIHDAPGDALSDGRQALAPESLPGLIRSLREIAAATRRAEKEEEERK